MTLNLFKVSIMSNYSLATKKNQITMMQCDHGGQEAKKTSKKAPRNGIFSDFDHWRPYIYIYIYRLNKSNHFCIYSLYCQFHKHKLNLQEFKHNWVKRRQNTLSQVVLSQLSLFSLKKGETSLCAGNGPQFPVGGSKLQGVVSE